MQEHSRHSSRMGAMWTGTHVRPEAGVLPMRAAVLVAAALLMAPLARPALAHPPGGEVSVDTPARKGAAADAAAPAEPARTPRGSTTAVDAPVPAATTGTSAIAQTTVVAVLVDARTPGGVQAPPPGATEPPAAASPRIRIATGVDLLGTNAYVWRGFVPTDAFSVQPNLWLTIGDLTVSSWGNTARRSVGGLLTEHDLTVDYSRNIGPYALSAGWINYLFPPAETGRHSNELYVGVADASYLNPSVRVFQDVHAGAGTYVNVAIDHEYAIGSSIAVTPSVAAGYNHHQWIATSTWSDVVVGVKVRLPTPNPHVTVAPFGNYSRSLARDLFRSRFYGGLGLTVR